MLLYDGHYPEMKNHGFSQRVAEEVEIEMNNENWRMESGTQSCAGNAYNKNRICHQEQLILDSIIKSLLRAQRFLSIFQSSFNDFYHMYCGKHE